MLITLTTLIVSLISFLTFINVPILILISILCMALCIAFTTGVLFSSWFSYLIFMIYIGGMLVMFSYFVAMTPNIFIKLSQPVSLLLGMMFSMLIFMLMFKFKVPYIYKFQYSMNSLYLKQNMMIFMIIVFLLLVMMLVIVKLVDKWKGPLRPFIYV